MHRVGVVEDWRRRVCGCSGIELSRRGRERSLLRSRTRVRSPQICCSWRHRRASPASTPSIRNIRYTLDWGHPLHVPCSARALSGSRCPNRLFDLRHNLYENSQRDSITTLFHRVSDVGLGYTPPRHQSVASTSLNGLSAPRTDAGAPSGRRPRTSAAALTTSNVASFKIVGWRTSFPPFFFLR
jgi:hypothetical protein